MTVNRKPSGTAATIPAALLYGTLSAAGITLAGTWISSFLINREVMPWDAAGYAVLGILLLSSWIGAVVTAEKTKSRRLMMCLAAGGTYFALLLVTTALFFGGQYAGVKETVLLIFCGSMLGVFTEYRGKTGRKKKKIRYHNR